LPISHGAYRQQPIYFFSKIVTVLQPGEEDNAFPILRLLASATAVIAENFARSAEPYIAKYHRKKQEGMAGHLRDT
jgi:hypothetical protein